MLNYIKMIGGEIVADLLEISKSLLAVKINEAAGQESP